MEGDFYPLSDYQKGYQAGKKAQSEAIEQAVQVRVDAIKAKAKREGWKDYYHFLTDSDFATEPEK